MRTVNRVRSRFCIGLLFIACFAKPAASESQPIVLWPNGAPGSQDGKPEETVRINADGEHIVSNVHHPSITPYLPAKDNSTGIAVIIAPGGGHAELWMDHEGYSVAKWLSGHGVAAFVLKYRLARQKNSAYTIDGDELADMQRAIRLVRSRATEWDMNPEMIGVMGFSAGGELAALAATHSESANKTSPDPIDQASSRPDFQALFYPAIPRDMHLSSQTPPAFLICGADDRTEIAEGVPELYLALRRAGVSAELHVYAGIGHGFGMRARNPAPVSEWPQLFLDWLKARISRAPERPAAGNPK
jgi:acetyl esterase/lipase